MLLWSASIFLLFSGLRLLLVGAPDRPSAIERLFHARREEEGLRKTELALLELQETLESGSAPAAEQWDQLLKLPPPWGRLAHSSVQELRKRGASLLPTLKRLREISTEHRKSLREARARSAQAVSQAALCAFFVPLFGATLQLLLPGLEEHTLAWVLGCVLAFLWAGTGALWMLTIADRARWGGLSAERRPWIAAALCGGERFLALLRSGRPADLAWSETQNELDREASGLSRLWGYSVWVSEPAARPARLSSETELALARAGTSIRRAVQVSLMEGKGCSERVEAALISLTQEIRSSKERELELVGTRVLKPLFICVAPSILALLAWGLYLSWSELGAGLG